MEPPAKQQKVSPITIVIPDGDFSIETIFPIALLSVLYPLYDVKFHDKSAEGAEFKLNKHICDSRTYLIRLNGVYLPQRNCYDFTDVPFRGNGMGRSNKGKKNANVQRYFDDSRRCKLVPLATSGLMYKMYGKLILSKITGFELADPNINWLLTRTYFDYIEIIDAYTRGYDLIRINDYRHKDDKQRFSNEMQTLPNLIKYYNLRWDEVEGKSEEEILTMKNERIHTIVDIIRNGFVNYVKFFAFSFIMGKDIVFKSCENSLSNPSRVILLERFVPWKEHVYNWEKENNKFGHFLFIIYLDTSNMWKISAVPENPGSFTSRKQLPTSWLGLRDEELEKVSGINGALFVHANGFIGGAKSKEACMQIAEFASSI